MARRLLLKTDGRGDIGERLLSSKLQILSGTGSRRPAIALSVLTGRLADEHDFSPQDEVLAVADPVAEAPAEPSLEIAPSQRSRPPLLARTVYLTDAHLRDIDAIIQAWQPGRTESSPELSQTNCALERADPCHNKKAVRNNARRVPRRLTRSAVLRRAIEHLRSAVEADPATSLLESE